MQLKTILIILLAIFFILSGINHFYNKHTLEEYARTRGLVSPGVCVKLAGVLLIFGGIAFAIPDYRTFGVVGLSIFLFVSSFTIHQFWKETSNDMRMIELLNFVKNLAILTELLYIGFV